MDAWLRAVLWDHRLPGTGTASGEKSFEVHRCKGRLLFDTGEVKMLQGVREVFELIDSPSDAGEALPTSGKIILIGRHLAALDFARSLDEALKE